MEQEVLEAAQVQAVTADQVVAVQALGHQPTLEAEALAHLGKAMVVVLDLLPTINPVVVVAVLGL